MKFALLPFVLASAHASAQVQLNVIVEGKQAGTATLKQSLQTTGEKRIEMRTELKNSEGKTLVTRLETLFDAKGAPIRKFLEMTKPGERFRKTIVVTFDKAGANVVIDLNGTRTAKSVDLVENAPRNNGAELWFIKNKPKLNASVQVYTFNLDTLQWQLETIQYSGQKLVKIKGVEYPAHEIRSDHALTYVDDKGEPLAITYGRMKLERVMSKALNLF